MFMCPVCGNNSYSISMRAKNVFKCNRCSVIFETPSKFGRINTTKNKETTVTEEKSGVHISST